VDVRPRMPELGIGVDTLPSRAWGAEWKAPVPAIYHRWADFLASKAPRYTPPLGAPSPYWVAAEQRRWPAFAIALDYAGESAAPVVVDIRPATPGQDSVYVVKTMFMAPDSRGDRQPLALMRVYAVQERGQWVFSNALPRDTREWQHTTVGPFNYVYPASHHFDRARAQRAVAFADSVAGAFGVARPSNFDYYLTDGPDEMYRIIGLDFFPSSTDGGGFTAAADRLLVSGNPSLGEEYRHEIVHVVLASLPTRGVHSLVWEGIATWLGGTLGMSAAESRRKYAAYLRAHPGVTLDSILAEKTYDQGFRPGGAALCQMVLERGGMRALKELLGAGRTSDDLESAATRIMGMSWPEIQREWRRVATRQKSKGQST